MDAFKTLTMAALLALAAPGFAAEERDADPLFIDAAEAGLDEYIWTKRPVVVFADSPADPRFLRQMKAFEEQPDELRTRDVIVIVDSDPAARSAVREKLHPRGFSLVLIGKDGQIKLRKPQPYDIRELTRVIDKLPLRQQEIRDRRAPPIR